MKRFVRIMVCAAVLALGLCACGGGEQKNNVEGDEAASGYAGASVITLKKDGSIEYRLVEDFGEDYSEDALKSLIDESITAYQKKAAQAQVRLKGCQKNKEDRLAVEMTFGDWNAYAGWNNYFLDYMYASEMGMDTAAIEGSTDGFFAGTISDAYNAGYGLEVTLNAVSEKNAKQTVSKSDLLGMGDTHIVILERGSDDEPVSVECFGEILYVSDGVSVTGKKSAQVDAMDGYGMIVFQ